MDQTTLYRMVTGQVGNNAIGRGGSSDNFFTKRGKSIENSLGTVGSFIVGNVDTANEKRNSEARLKKQNANLDNIAKKYGYADRHAVWDALDQAKANGDQETLDRLNNTIMPELQAQTATDADIARNASKDWEDYRTNSYFGKKVNQDRGKYLGSAINTLSTAVDLTGLSATPLANSIQGGIEGVADELEQNGFNDFSLERAGQNALIGATTGAVTGALNKGLSNSMAKRGGNLFKGSNKLTQGLNNLGSKTALGRVGSTIMTGAGRGALSGAVGGATGAGLSAAMNGGDVIGSALEGAKQGVGQGALTGGIMSGANLALSKTPGVGKFYNELQSAKGRWDQSGGNFDERLTNTLTSGDSAVGDWLMRNTNSKTLGSIGNIGDTIRDYTDQGMGIRKATDEAYRDLIREYTEGEEGGYEGLLQNAKAAGAPGDNNYQSARRFLDGGGMDIYPEDMLESLRSVYGDDFKESIYKNKDGSWRIKNGEPYVETMYKNQLAQRIAKDLDAYDANTYSPGSEKEGYVPGIADNYETAVKARNGRLDYLRNELENGRISYGELAELQDYKPQILALGDAQLAEAAGIPEDEFKAYNSKQNASKFVGVDTLGNSSEYTPEQLSKLIQEYDNYKAPKTLSGNSFSEVDEAVGPAGGELMNIYKTMNGGVEVNPYNRQSWEEFENWVDSQRNNTPTTAKGWLKRAGERIVEDVNNTNLGNRIDDVSKKVSTRKLSNTIIDEGSAYAPKDTVKKFLLENRKYVANNPNDFDGYKDILDDFDGMIKRIDAIGDDNIYIEENPMATSGYHILSGEEARQNFSNIDAASQPKDLGGWLKKAGQRIVEDVNNTNLGNRIKRVDDTYSNDIRNLKINDYNNEPIEGEVVEAPRQTTRQMPVQQLDAWDRLAQENGYNSYDEVIDSYLKANPGVKLNQNGAAGQILSWLDENPNTPTTAGGWAKQALNRAAEDLDNSNLGMRIKDVNEDNPQTQLYRALNGENEDLPEVFKPRSSDQIENQNKLQSLGKQIRNTAKTQKYSALYDSLNGKTAERAIQTNAPDTLAEMGVRPENYLEAAKTSNYINGVVSDLADQSKVKVMSPNLVDKLNAATEDVIFTTPDAQKKFNTAIRQIVADGSSPDEYSAGYLLEKSRDFSNKAANLRGNAGDVDALRTAYTNVKYVLRDEATNALANANITGDMTNQKIAQGLADMGANEKVIDYYTAPNDDGSAPTAKDYIRRSSLFEQARDMGNQVAAEKFTRSASKQPTNMITRLWRSSGLEQPIDLLLRNTVAPAASVLTDTAGRVIETAGNIGAKISGDYTPTETPSVATPIPISNANSSAMNIYNAIGRTEGLSNIDQARTANYISDATQDMNAESGYMPPLGATTSYGAPITSTSLYDSMTGATTASTQAPTEMATNQNTYFQPTGDYWTDTLARALTSAINADDVTAFASLYNMYQDALSKLEKSNSSSSSNSGEKITATQQRANAAMNSLNRISQMTPDLGYNLSNIPIIGDIATFGGNDYEAEAKSLAQQIGYMVSGANIKEEEAYNIGKAYVPQPWDSDQTRQNKLQRAYEIIQQYQNGYAS